MNRRLLSGSIIVTVSVGISLTSYSYGLPSGPVFAVPKELRALPEAGASAQAAGQTAAAQRAQGGSAEQDHDVLQAGCPCDSDIAPCDPDGMAPFDDGDGFTDVDDILAVLESFFGSPPCPGGGYGDINCDGIIDVLDIIAVLQGFAGSAVCGPGSGGVADNDIVLTLVPVGGLNANGGQSVAIEAFTTPNVTRRYEQGQWDVPCIVAGSISGTMTATSGCADCDGDGTRTSTGGIAYLFGNNGLAPYQPATCITANTPAIGSTTVVVPAGATRYLGTVNYAVSLCAGGDFPINFQCTDQPGGVCDNNPETSNTTRYHEDSPVDPQTGPLMSIQSFNGTTIHVGVFLCCDGATCHDGLNPDCCATTYPGAVSGGLDGELCNPPISCADCTDNSQCNDGQFCNGAETCNIAIGQCQPGAPPVCPGSPLCGMCDPAANGGAGGCVFQNGVACGSQADTDCDNPNTCLNGACQANFEPAETACGSPADTACDDPDTCDGSGACRPNTLPEGGVCGGTGCGGLQTCQGGSCVNGGAPADCTVCNCNADVAPPFGIFDLDDILFVLECLNGERSDRACDVNCDGQVTSRDVGDVLCQFAGGGSGCCQLIAGACCEALGGLCIDTPQIGCVSGTYLGDGTRCDNWPCDCNGNGLPDRCDISCDADGGACNVAGCGTGTDCDADGTLDECEGADPDATGACCRFLPGIDLLICTETTEVVCMNDLGGSWAGPCSKCSTQFTVTADHFSEIFTHVVLPPTDPVDCGGSLPRSVRGSCPSPPVGPYYDPWVSGTSVHSFASSSIPPNYFGSGSQSYNGTMTVRGSPAGHPIYQLADTVIWRSADPFTRCDVPDIHRFETVSIKVDRLKLVSVTPITVFTGAGNSSDCDGDGVQDSGQLSGNDGNSDGILDRCQWSAVVGLSSAPQPAGFLTAVKTHCTGGNFTSFLQVHPKFTFTNLSTGFMPPPLDPGAAGMLPVQLSAGTTGTAVPKWVTGVDPLLPVEFDGCSAFHPGTDTKFPGNRCGRGCHGDVTDDCPIDVDDILYVLDAFIAQDCALYPNANVMPCADPCAHPPCHYPCTDPGQVIDVDDIVSVIKAFEGILFECAPGCPEYP